MQPMSPVLTSAMSRARVAELRHMTRAPRRTRRESRRRPVLRQATGWFLIRVGLRLAVGAQPLRPAAR